MPNRIMTPEALMASQETNSREPYIFLVEFDLSATTGEVYRFTRDNVDTFWRGYTWVSAPVNMSRMEETGDGSVPGLQFTMHDLDGGMEGFLDTTRDLDGITCISHVVHGSLLDQDESMITQEHYLSNGRWNDDDYLFSWDVVAENPLFQSVPNGRCLADGCWYTRPTQCLEVFSCGHTLADCRERGNTEIFGGFPGLATVGV